MTPANMPSHMPSRGGLLARIAIAAAVGAFIVVCVVLPAEYRKDPTGFGRLTGLLELTTPIVETPPDDAAPEVEPVKTAPDAAAYHKVYDVPWKTETIELPLGPDGEVEYKFRMLSGQSMVYSWQVDRGSVYYDFHGHPENDPKASKTYREEQENTKANGVFIAPIEGIHGWYWLNLTGEPLKVTLKVSGYYVKHGVVGPNGLE